MGRAGRPDGLVRGVARRGAERAAPIGAACGALALLGASVGYFCADAPLRREPLSSHLVEMVVWSIASLVLGPLLGAIGSQVVRKGLIGMFAGLAVPAGAVAQTLLLRVSEPGRTGAHTTAEAIVCVAAAAVAVFVLARTLRARRLMDVPPEPGARTPTAEAPIARSVMDDHLG